MKKKVLTIIAIVCIAFTASAFVTGQVYYIPLQVTDIDPTNPHNPHKGPIVIPSVSLDDHTLYFGTLCDFEIKKGTEFKVNTINSDN